MRLLIVLGVLCFFLSSNHIDPNTLLPSSEALAFAPANNDFPADDGYVLRASLTQPEAMVKGAEPAQPETQSQPESPVPSSAATDRPASPTQPRRKVSVAEMCDSVAEAAQTNNLPIGFLIRLIWQESGFNSDIVSSAGAQGVAQFMPRVAAEWGLQDPFDPLQALPASARLLRSLHQQFGNLGLAAAAYNAGSGRIQNWLTKRGKLPQETRSYVLNVTGRAAEQWVKAAPHSTNFRIPNRAPCQEVAARFNAEPVPLPLPRLTLPSVVYASALASKVKVADAAKPAPVPSRADKNKGEAGPAPIMVAEKAGRPRNKSLITDAHGKRQQLILPVKLAAKSSAKKPLQLALMTKPTREKSAGKSKAKTAEKKSPAKGRIQLAMATRTAKR